MKQGLLETIKSRGFWRINIQPLVAAMKIKNLGDCKEIVEKNMVKLRGWYYPHFPRRQDQDSGLEPGNDYYQGWIDWGAHKEFWRFYQSGQFIHYMAVREDWMKEDNWYSSYAAGRPEPGAALGMVSTIYQVTEIFEFLRRLARAGIYDEGVRISLGLKNTEGRILWLDDPGRIELSVDYKTGAAEIFFEKQYSKNDAVMNSKEAAFEAIIFFFDRFGWHMPSIEVIKNDQERLLNGRA